MPPIVPSATDSLFWVVRKMFISLVLCCSSIFEGSANLWPTQTKRSGTVNTALGIFLGHIMAGWRIATLLQLVLPHSCCEHAVSVFSRSFHMTISLLANCQMGGRLCDMGFPRISLLGTWKRFRVIFYKRLYFSSQVMTYVVYYTLFKILKFNLIILDFSLFVCQFLNVLEHLDFLSILIYLGNGTLSWKWVSRRGQFSRNSKIFSKQKCTLEHLEASGFTWNTFSSVSRENKANKAIFKKNDVFLMCTIWYDITGVTTLQGHLTTSHLEVL